MKTFPFYLFSVYVLHNFSFWAYSILFVSFFVLLYMIESIFFGAGRIKLNHSTIHQQQYQQTFVRCVKGPFWETLYNEFFFLLLTDSHRWCSRRRNMIIRLWHNFSLRFVKLLPFGLMPFSHPSSRKKKTTFYFILKLIRSVDVTSQPFSFFYFPFTKFAFYSSFSLFLVTEKIYGYEL